MVAVSVLLGFLEEFWVFMVAGVCLVFGFLDGGLYLFIPTMVADKHMFRAATAAHIVLCCWLWLVSLRLLGIFEIPHLFAHCMSQHKDM